MTYRIVIAPTALKMLRAIKDRRIRTQLRNRIVALKQNPEQQGKALVKDLSKYRAVRAVGQRYRIVYRIDGDQIQIYVVAVGMRKDGDKRDIYRLTQKLIRLGLLD